jgi:adenine-specific DNA-methyltransferase
LISNISQIEGQRRLEQDRLDAARQQIQRNRLGQFATPAALAWEILNHAQRIWDRSPVKIRFLDPALGTGAFYSALLQVFSASAIEAATGVEIDSSFASTAQRLWRKTGLKVIENDFLLLPPPPSGKRFNFIVANPPYVRHHHLSQMQKAQYKPISQSIMGTNINGLMGLYCYFMIIAHRWMSQNALAAWLVPSEFMDVNYGAIIKKYLTEKVTLLQIHRYDPDELQFDDALVSSAVVVFRNTTPPDGHQTLFSFGGTLAEPKQQNRLDSEELRRERKWTRLGHLRAKNDKAANPDFVTMSSLFRIRRGIATGNNRFFILPLPQAREQGIDLNFLKPILPSPRYLLQTVIEADEYGYPRLEKPLALIDSELPEDQIHDLCPALWNYLQTGIAQGIDQTYLTKRRTPWYHQEQRQPAPFLCTYMGRSLANSKPFRFISNRSRAIATNVYLLLYPIGALSAFLNQGRKQHEIVLHLLEEIKLEVLIDEARVYGGGLFKLEPAELGRVSADSIIKALKLETKRPPVQTAFEF